jgi:hypothetical protein
MNMRIILGDAVHNCFYTTKITEDSSGSSQEFDYFLYPLPLSIYASLDRLI